MNHSSMQELERVFELVYQSAPELRDEVLQRECKGDTKLQEQVLTLLLTDSDESILDDARSAAQLLADEVPQPKTMIDSYLLIKQIGRGGMGVVFLAEQQSPIQRSVALKVILGGAASSNVIARFEAEKQALAVFDHPNLTKIFDSGVSDQGHLYFAMDYVSGSPITRHCDEQELDLRSRVEMFLNVADAVAHAHQRGIIHRDIKPSNVLVQKDGSRRTPKVIDFGISKALHSGSNVLCEVQNPEVRCVVGTPQYMSPEQVEMKPGTVDVRTDVYSLGILLYELIVGSTPLILDAELPDLISACQLIKEGEFESALARVSRWDPLALDSTHEEILKNRQASKKQLVRFLESDLNAIILKATDKDPNRRYSTVEAFQADLTNFLACRPVAASPAGILNRTRKLVRRNQLVSLIAVATCFVVVAAISLVALFRSNEKIARLESQKMRSQLAVSEFNRNQALKRADLGDQLRGRLLERKRNKLAVKRAICRWMQLDNLPTGADAEIGSFMVSAIFTQFGMKSISPLGNIDQEESSLPIFDKRSALPTDDAFPPSDLSPEEFYQDEELGGCGPTVSMSFMLSPALWSQPAEFNENELPFFALHQPMNDVGFHFMVEPDIEGELTDHDELFQHIAANFAKSALRFCELLIEEQTTEFADGAEILADSYDIQTQILIESNQFKRAVESSRKSVNIRSQFGDKNRFLFSQLLCAEALQKDNQELAAKDLVKRVKAEIGCMRPSKTTDEIKCRLREIQADLKVSN